MFNANSGRILSICPIEPVLTQRRAFLEGQGYQVISCADPAEGQSKAMSERFSIVIVGHGFGTIEVREMIRWIRHKKVPVLFVYEGPQPSNLCADAFLPSLHEVEQLVRVVGWLAWG